MRGYLTGDENAAQKIPPALLQYYRENLPGVLQTQKNQIEQAGLVLQQIYRRNVFPKMNVGWETYPNNLGHQNFPGCFRCHDGDHKTAQGEEITQDCSSCHDILTQEEEKPALIPDLLAVKK